MEPPFSPPKAVLPVLELEHTDVSSTRRTNLVVLEQVSWQIAPGDYWFVGGLHRSGKTDLLVAMAGLVPPKKGIHRIFGKDSATTPREELLAYRIKVGVVFDGGQLLHHLTVAENVALPVGYHRNQGLAEAVTKVEGLLEFAGLKDMRRAYPANISRNWQQRAGLARALALAPDVLLLDNPLSGLDPQEIRWWLRCLQQLASGHELLGGKKLTLAVTGDSLPIWRDQAQQFAVIKDRRFHVLPGRPALGIERDELVEHLLPAESNSA